jgi:hypothetical protein
MSIPPDIEGWLGSVKKEIAWPQIKKGPRY